MELAVALAFFEALSLMNMLQFYTCHFPWSTTAALSFIKNNHEVWKVVMTLSFTFNE